MKLCKRTLTLTLMRMMMMMMMMMMMTVSLYNITVHAQCSSLLHVDGSEAKRLMAGRSLAWMDDDKDNLIKEVDTTNQA